MEWIETNSKRPDDADNVLVAVKDGYGKKCYFIHMGYFMPDENQWFNYLDYKIPPPSFWMFPDEPEWID